MSILSIIGIIIYIVPILSVRYVINVDRINYDAQVWENVYDPAEYKDILIIRLVSIIPILNIIVLIAMILEYIKEGHDKPKNLNKWILLFGSTKMILRRVNKESPNIDILNLNINF